MIRWLYSWLLGLHPRTFRMRFGREMLAIFDEVDGCQSVLDLFGDLAVSLFRQWVLRPEFRSVEMVAAPSGSTDVPVLVSLESYRLRPTTVLGGTLVSLVAIFAAVAAISHPGKPRTWLIGAHRTAGNLLVVSRSSVAGVEPNTLVLLPEDPWRAAASIYFKVIALLGSLDANGDFVISPSEIDAAPSALRRLDRNHDGELSPEECGLYLGQKETLRPEFEKRARIEFMRFHPVLAALDYDHDGVISAEEIRNSSQSLRRLDVNGDGSLTPDEVMPTPAAAQAASIFSQLDTNHDGRISGTEIGGTGAEALRGILLNADRNRDGDTTLAELTNELRRREWIQTQTEAGLKAALATK